MHKKLFLGRLIKYPKSVMTVYTMNFLYLFWGCQGSGCSNRARMLWGVCDFLWVTDRPCLRLGAGLQNRANQAGKVCLEAYAAMSSANLHKKRINYKIRPKWNFD